MSNDAHQTVEQPQPFTPGITRAQVCSILFRTDRVVRLWIELFNRGGIDALRTKRPSGRPRKMKLERIKDLLVPVLENPAQAGRHGERVRRVEESVGVPGVLQPAGGGNGTGGAVGAVDLQPVEPVHAAAGVDAGAS